MPLSTRDLSGSDTEMAPTGSKVNYTDIAETDFQDVDAIWASYQGSITKWTAFISEWVDKLPTDGDTIDGWISRGEGESAYDGYDANYILAVVSKKLTHEEIYKTLVLGILRGNNLTKIKGSIGEEGKKLVDKLILNLGVQDSLKKAIGKKSGSTVQRKRVITLSRILTSLPCQTCLTLTKMGETPVSSSLLPPNYPKAMRHSAFAALMYDDLPVQIKKAYYLYQVLFTKLIKPDISTANAKSEVEKYTSFIMRNFNMAVETKADWLKRFGIIGAVGTSLPLAIEKASDEYDKMP